MTKLFIFPCAIVLAIVGVRAAPAQDQLPPPTMMEPSVAATPAPGETPAPPNPPASLSTWLAYPRLECCGPVGGDGPIYGELFVRTGPSLPVEGQILGHVLETGWKVEGGGRSLFFNPARDAAWDIELGISNTRYQGQRQDIQIPLKLGPATLRSLNFTDVNFYFGREWYLRGSAEACAPRWRVGFDAGPRVGSIKAEFHEITHRTDTLYALAVALHTDVEMSYGCCTYFAGFRAEWAYDWSNIFQAHIISEMQEVNFLLNLGVRF